MTKLNASYIMIHQDITGIGLEHGELKEVATLVSGSGWMDLIS